MGLKNEEFTSMTQFLSIQRELTHTELDHTDVQVLLEGDVDPRTLLEAAVIVCPLLQSITGPLA